MHVIIFVVVGVKYRMVKHKSEVVVVAAAAAVNDKQVFITAVVVVVVVRGAFKKFVA